MMKNPLLSLLGVVLCILVFAACGSSADEPSSSLLDDASASPSASVSPSPTAKPTAKPTTKPTASPTAKPTATPTASPTTAPTAAPEPTKAPVQEPTEAPVQQPTQAPTPAPTPEPTPEPTPVPPSPYDYVGVDINTFYSIFGYPSGSDYGPSCMGDGEDGLLYYSGYVVVTYRDASGYETVLSVG